MFLLKTDWIKPHGLRVIKFGGYVLSFSIFYGWNGRKLIRPQFPDGQGNKLSVNFTARLPRRFGGGCLINKPFVLVK